MKINLQELITRLNVTATQFAENIGVQRSSISHFLSGRNNPSLDVLRKILMAYPQINAQWLISGEGDMMKSDVSSPNISIEAPSPIENNLFSPVEDESPEPYGVRYQEDLPDNINEKEKKRSTEKHSASLSKVERVLIFYPNGTFREYLPQ